MPSPPSHSTRLLRSLAAGDGHAGQQLLPLVYDELHRLAQDLMHKEPGNHTLQATALVHEVYLRIVDSEDREWNNRQHFLRVAGQAMRHILVEAARARQAGKRGGDLVRITFADALMAPTGSDTEILAIDSALARLAAADPQLAEIVELKFFAGVEFQDIARMQDMPLRTLERRWRFARIWLAREITLFEDGEASGGS